MKQDRSLLASVGLATLLGVSACGGGASQPEDISTSGSLPLNMARAFTLQSADNSTQPRFVSRALPTPGVKGAWTMAFGAGKVMGWRESEGVVRVILLQQGQISELPDIVWKGQTQRLGAEDCLRVNLQGRVACTFGQREGVAVWRPDLNRWQIMASAETSGTTFRVMGINERGDTLIERRLFSSEALLVNEDGRTAFLAPGTPMTLNDAADIALSQRNTADALELVVMDSKGVRQYAHGMVDLPPCKQLYCYGDRPADKAGLNVSALSLTSGQRVLAFGQRALFNGQGALATRSVFVQADSTEGQVWEAGVGISDTEQVMDIRANVNRLDPGKSQVDPTTVNPYPVGNQQGDVMLSVTLADYFGAMTRTIPVLYLGGAFYDARTLLADPAAAPGVAFGRSINTLRQMVECAGMQTNDQCWLIEPESLAANTQ